jgi:hypothetical protein
MTHDDDQRSERLRMEEYKALRAEGLRSAGIIANTVWLGTAQFALTIGVAATCFKKEGVDSYILLLVFLIVLSIESAAGTFMFLSELGKYVRVGSYIRENIEKVYPGVMGWESWIQPKRSIGFPILSIIILQFPFLCPAILLALSSYHISDFAGWPEMDIFVRKYFNTCLSKSLLVFLIVIDLAAISSMLLQIKQEGQHRLNYD